MNHISDKAGSLSEKGAYIACIKIQYLYFNITQAEKYLDDDGKLSGIQKEIENLRSRYSELNHENPIYIAQANYLERIYNKCKDLRNGVVIFKGIRTMWFDTKIIGLD